MARDKGVPGMRSDSLEWVCSKLGVRTDQRLTEMFRFAAQEEKILKIKR